MERIHFDQCIEWIALYAKAVRTEDQEKRYAQLTETVGEYFFLLPEERDEDKMLRIISNALLNRIDE